MNSEINTCAFCRAVTEVSRQYLHAKNKPSVGDGFDFIYYCDDCGILEIIKTPVVLTKDDLKKQKEFILENKGCIYKSDDCEICPRGSHIKD